MKSHYYSVECKNQYGWHLKSVVKMSREKAIRYSTGCEDSAGYRTAAYRATCSGIKLASLLNAGELHFDIHGIARKDGVEIECIA